MLDILDTYLTTSVTPELKTTIAEAHTAFDKIGLDNYDNDFEAILLMNDSVNTNDTVDDIIRLTKDIQADIFKEHEIQLVDDITIEMATLFINGIMDIQHYANKAEMLKTVTLDLNANEVF